MAGTTIADKVWKATRVTFDVNGSPVSMTGAAAQQLRNKLNSLVFNLINGNKDERIER